MRDIPDLSWIEFGNGPKDQDPTVLTRRHNDDSTTGDYYVIHVGRGTDGGFGDYSPPYWSEEPVNIDGRTIWFSHESEADEAVKKLNQASSDVFPYVQYSGEFPMEYEWRKITRPTGPACDADQAIALVTAAHSPQWPETSYGPDWDESDDE